MSRAVQSASPQAAVDAARAWHQQFASGATRLELDAAPESVDALAAFAGVVLASGASLLILVPDDEPLPALSTALDLGIRPLCLVLPSAEFAARIALRATISLLRSRLARDAEDDRQHAAWVAQRARLEEHKELWESVQRWGAANDRSDWPRDVGHLFPVRMMPIATYRMITVQSADYAVFYQCEPDPATFALSGRQLVVGRKQATHSSRAIVADDASLRLKVELAQLTQDVGELELELATAQEELTGFTRRYYDLIGPRMAELDALRARLAAMEARRAPEDSGKHTEARRLQEEAERTAEERRRFSAADDGGQPKGGTETEPPPFRPTQDVKRLFRQLAQRIHPDRALDEDDRAWRTQLMSEANRAYRAGNADALREVAALWEEGPATRRSAVEPIRDVIATQVARMRRRLEEIEGELNRLFGSSLYELHAACRQAARVGRDLLHEMAHALDQQIAGLKVCLELEGET